MVFCMRKEVFCMYLKAGIGSQWTCYALYEIVSSLLNSDQAYHSKNKPVFLKKIYTL